MKEPMIKSISILICICMFVLGVVVTWKIIGNIRQTLQPVLPTLQDPLLFRIIDKSKISNVHTIINTDFNNSERIDTVR